MCRNENLVKQLPRVYPFVRSLCGLRAAGRHACATLNWRNCQIILLLYCVLVWHYFDFLRTYRHIHMFLRAHFTSSAVFTLCPRKRNDKWLVRLPPEKWLSGEAYAENCLSQCNMWRTCCCVREAAYRPNGGSDREKHKQRFRAIDTHASDVYRHMTRRTRSTSKLNYYFILDNLFISLLFLMNILANDFRGNQIRSDWNFIIFNHISSPSSSVGQPVTASRLGQRWQEEAHAANV